MSNNKTDNTKTGRNKPCPCGSGKKFKKCHLDEYKKHGFTAETPNKKNPFELIEKLKSEFRVKKCMHPNSLGCNSVIAAHTIQMKGTLDKISKNYHLFRVSQKINDFGKGFEKISTNKASTFYGFCEKHDSIFHIFENKDYDIHSIEQAFYIAYRTVCMELYNKQAALSAFSCKDLKNLLDKSYYEACFKGTSLGEEDSRKVKKLYDNSILTTDFKNFSYIAVLFESTIPIYGAGSCNSNNDFLQKQITSYTYPEYISASLISVKIQNTPKTLFLLHWPTSFKSAEICAKSLLSISDKDKPLAILNFMLLNIENCFFSADWIISLDDKQRNYILELSQNQSPLKTLPTTIPKFDLDWKIFGIHNSN
jgi:hypothetical protein